MEITIKDKYMIVVLKIPPNLLMIVSVIVIKKNPIKKATTV